MFKCILVGIDGSEQSALALDYASSLAEKYGSKIILAHAYPHTSDLRQYEEYDKLVAERKRTGQQLLETARNRLGEAPTDVQEELLEEPAADAILKVAEIQGADLILMGSRGMGKLQSLLFGSVSAKVAHYAPCPVMIVR